MSKKVRPGADYKEDHTHTHETPEPNHIRTRTVINNLSRAWLLLSSITLNTACVSLLLVLFGAPVTTKHDVKNMFSVGAFIACLCGLPVWVEEEEVARGGGSVGGLLRCWLTAVGAGSVSGSSSSASRSSRSAVACMLGMWVSDYWDVYLGW